MAKLFYYLVLYSYSFFINVRNESHKTAILSTAFVISMPILFLIIFIILFTVIYFGYDIPILNKKNKGLAYFIALFSSVVNVGSHYVYLTSYFRKNIIVAKSISVKQQWLIVTSFFVVNSFIIIVARHVIKIIK